MSSLRAAALALLILLILPTALLAEEATPKAPPVQNTWFVTGVTTVGTRVLFTNYWSKEGKFRAESVIEGHRVVSIVNGGTYYSIDDVLATGVAIERDPKAVAVDKRRGRPFADEWSQLLRAGGESVGREELSGRTCEVFRLTNSTGRRTIWVSIEEPRVPVRIVTFDRNSGREEIVDYVNWMQGLTVADEFFEPAKQVVLIKLDYQTYARESRIGPVGPVPVLYRSFLEAEWD